MGGEVLRLLLWRLLGLLAVLAGFAAVAWLVGGGPGRELRGKTSANVLRTALHGLSGALAELSHVSLSWAPAPGVFPVRLLLAAALAATLALVGARWRARRRRRYVRLRVQAYRTDRASAQALVTMFEALHKRLLQRWWRRLLWGQPGLALEVHHAAAKPSCAWLAVCCPQGLERMVQAALQAAYANCTVIPASQPVGVPEAVLRLKKHAEFIKRVKALDRFEQEREPPVNRLITTMAACGQPAFVQLAMTPAPAFFEGLAKRVYKRHEAHLSRQRREHLLLLDRSIVEDAELRGGLDVQHRPLFFVDVRVVGPSRAVCERIASELRAEGAENRLIERGTAIRHGLLGLYGRRVRRGEGNPLPCFRKGVFASTELAALWQMPSVDYATVPFARAAVPLAPAPPGVFRPPNGPGTLQDALGAVSIHVELRKQNTAVPGTVEQGKSSYLVATVAEDLRRERCAVIVLDPKGDAAEAAVSLVPSDRTCTLLDLAQPTCGFNPLAVDAPADVIADYVVAALKNLFTDADIRASSDRYLRNAIIAVLAHDRRSTLWDAARLLSVGEEGYAYRRAVGAHVRTLPEFKEISEFFTAELTAQLADARSTTTAKLDAPVNKLARLLNSPSIKRVLLNHWLRVDFEQVIAGAQVLVVKGALGAMGAGNTSVLMQLLLGMLDAALARQQDLLPAAQRVTVALKIDEAPLVLNRGFAETMALKRSAGLETVACWQTDAQWVDRDVRDQLDALFAHRVYFATASARDARAAVALTMAEFSDTVRPGIERLSSLGHPDVRLHLPKHHAIVSWSTHEGRQAPFIAQTLPLQVDRERLARHEADQRLRGARHLSDLRQPHWDRARRAERPPSGDAREPVREPSAARPPAPQRPAAERAPALSAPVAVSAPAGQEPHLPATPADSYRELVALDHAHSVRWARAPGPQRAAFVPDPLDVEVLALIAGFRHVLSSQLHRRFNPQRAATTTQRRLKRLSDAGLVERLQFHRRDGGGTPMCYAITSRGLQALVADGRLHDMPAAAASAGPGAGAGSPAEGERHLRRVRRDVRTAGWALAMQRTLGPACRGLQGPDESVLSPPRRARAGEQAPLGPADLRLPGGRAPHDFLRTVGGQRLEAERFETVRPDATIQAHAQARAVDVIVEFENRIARGQALDKLERYDHFLAGWSAHVRRYGPRREALARVVFVCVDRACARESARRADGALCACRAYAGEYPFDWEYPGREQILFASERDMHEGLLHAYGVPRVPPEVRVRAAHGDPRAGEALARSCQILPEAAAAIE
jgi:Replication-relaxation